MKYDIAILGAGPGGYNAALKAAKLGAKAVLIEKDQLGGVCLNWGCIPTKTLLKSSLTYRQVKKAYLYGIEIENARLDFDKVMQRKNKVVSALRSGLSSLLKTNGIEVINGTGCISGINRISIDNFIVEAKNIIIATGTSPDVLPVEGMEDSCVILSDQALSLDEVPASVVIIGGGVVGIEFAAMLNDFGTGVTVIELKENILSGFDFEVSVQMRKMLGRAGIEIITSASVKSIRDGVVTFEQQGQADARKADKVMVSVGRKPNTDGLFSSDLGLQMKNSYIITDFHMRTNVDNIFAIGDVNGKEMLAHTAYAEGTVAAENALGINSEMTYESIPKCVYTYPEIAMVGLTEIEAKDIYGSRIKVGKYPLRSNGRALAEGIIEGFCKVISNDKDGSILGVHIIAPYATEMINAATLAIKQGIKDIEISKLIYPHPTISEIIGEAFMEII